MKDKQNSGMHKKDFIAQSCKYSHIVIEDNKKAIRRIVNAIHDMQIDLEAIVGQLQSGNFSLSREGYQEMKVDYMDFLITVVDILDNAAYLFEKEVPSNRRNRKAKVELEQFRTVLKGTQGKAEIWNEQKENILAFSSLYPYTLVKVRTGGDIHGKIIRWRSISGKRRGDCGG